MFKDLNLMQANQMKGMSHTMTGIWMHPKPKNINAWNKNPDVRFNWKLLKHKYKAARKHNVVIFPA